MQDLSLRLASHDGCLNFQPSLHSQSSRLSRTGGTNHWESLLSRTQMGSIYRLHVWPFYCPIFLEMNRLRAAYRHHRETLGQEEKESRLEKISFEARQSKIWPRRDICLRAQGSGRIFDGKDLFSRQVVQEENMGHLQFWEFRCSVLSAVARPLHQWRNFKFWAPAGSQKWTPTSPSRPI